MKVDFKRFKTKGNIKLIIGTLVAANAIATFVPSLGAHKTDNQTYSLEQSVSTDITLEEMKNMIYSSSHLTDEEKAFLYNEALFEDILPYVNQSEYMKFVYRSKFDNLDIKNISPIMYNTILPYAGWYPGMSSSNLYVKNYDINDSESIDTLAHEYMHATQDLNIYPFFYEASAELIADEYYGGGIDSYRPTIKALEILMEIIGAEPIKLYTFTGDFSMIEERVRPYLSAEEYNLFIECISEPLGPNSNKRNQKLMSIYQSLYLNIYGQPMRNDEIISTILSENDTLVRPYFNERLGDSYYLTYNNSKDKSGDGVEYHYLAPISEKENIFTVEHQL